MACPLRNPVRCLVLLLLALELAACGGADTGWAGTVRDSAGIEIVTSPTEGIWGAEHPWTFEEELRIGGSSATENAALFATVAAVGADEAGRIYILDMQAREARVFDESGAHIETFGGPGEGPGRIQQGMSLLVRDDGQFYVPDLGNGRINVYALGQEPESIPFRVLQSGSVNAPVRWLLGPDGRILVQLRSFGFLQQGSDSPPPTRDPIVAYDPSGEVPPDTITTLPTGETFGPGRGTGLGQFQIRLFAPEPVWTIFEDGVVAQGMSSAYRIQFRSIEGEVRRIVEKQVVTREVTEADEERIREAMRRTVEEQGLPPQAVEPMLEAVTFAETYPAFANFMAGPDHTLWVQQIMTAETFDPGSLANLQEIGSPDWEVFDAEGRFLGTVTMPERFVPMTWSGDHLYGVTRDDLDVQAVVRLRLVRG